MKDRPLRWGILGTANINRALINPLRTSERNNLLAVASRVKDRAEDYARQNKINRAYGSYAGLLDDPEIDVIYIPLPNHLHAEWTIKAVQAGKHVLCEKPLALNLAEVDAISSSAEKYHKLVVEAFMYRSHPQTLKVKEIIASGKLGRVRLVRGSYTYMDNNPYSYRWNHAMGGGSLWDVGCYPLSYARAMVGEEPLGVFGWQVTGSTGVDEMFLAQMRFPGNVFAQFDCGVRIPYCVFMEFIGDEANLFIPNPFNPGTKEFLYLTKKRNVEKIKVKGADPYQCEVEDMADAILLGKPPRVSLADSHANTAAMLALFESASSGKSIRI
jgi:xylose dehydrogenase (NAD/NADP)